MLGRLLALVGGLAVIAVAIPDLTERYLAFRQPFEATPATLSEPVKQAGAGRVALPADGAGHFRANFKINGRAETGLVDTGASMIAINVSAARRFGLSPASLDFRASVSTANGVVKGAPVTLDRVDIGSISLRGIEAIVLPDKALSGMLVGMTFLNRLSSYRVEAGVLHLSR